MYAPQRRCFRFSVLGAGILALLLASQAPAADFYYVIVFASQKDGNPPRYAHTFATFVKATGEGSNPRDYRLESHTISWTPASFDIRVLRLMPERGVNLDLDASLRLARSWGADVVKFGPYRVDKRLYDRALRQIDNLERGRMLYKAVDTRFSPTEVSNCIHAVSSLVGDETPVGQTGWGAPGSASVVESFGPFIRDDGKRHNWVSERLGLGRYEMEEGEARPAER
jgi:hypothetical protein